MKLVDVIKTQNGRSFLGDRPEQHISVNHYRLELEVVGYNPDEEYEECEFSYKEYARKLTKYASNTTVLWNIMCDMYGRTGINKSIANFYVDRVFDFDGDFFELEKNGEISFMPYNKVQKILPDGKFEEKGRQRMSAFKFFKKIIPEKIANEHQIQDFVNLITSMLTMEFRVEFVRGMDIARVYNEVDMKDGWAKSSCMRGRSLEKFVLYTDNPKVCELGVIYDKEQIVGRFLRWNTKELGWVEDTLYYKTYAVQAWYDQRCRDEEIWKKIHAQRFVKGEQEHTKMISVDVVKPLRDYTGDRRPYLDTMGYGKGKILFNGVEN